MTRVASAAVVAAALALTLGAFAQAIERAPIHPAACAGLTAQECAIIMMEGQ